MIELNSSFPVFIVDSVDEAKTFYTGYFNFDIAFANEWYLHLVSDSGIQVGFMLPGQTTQPAVFQSCYSGSGVIFSVEVGNADNAYAQAQQQKLKIVLDIRSEDWGQRHFCIEDPHGIHIDVVQAIEASEAYQSGYNEK